MGVPCAQVATIDASNPAAVAFSPRNTYLTVFQKPQQGAGNAEKNLKVDSQVLISQHARLPQTAHIMGEKHVAYTVYALLTEA